MAGDNASTLSALQAKYDTLRARIEGLGGAVVAFSGGVDSTLLLKVAHEALGEKAIAATIDSCFVPRAELDEAVEFCKDEGIEHIVITYDPLEIESIVANPTDRCYICKKTLMGLLLDTARERGIEHVIEGSNTDDANVVRPGRRALAELGIESPLAENGFSKDDVRLLAMSLMLECWDKPSAACLASRFPYGEVLTAGRLTMVEKAEGLLRDAGFEQVRVRAHGDLARIEVPADELADLLAFNEGGSCSAALHELGFKFITLDLDGFRSGCFDAQSSK